MHDPVECFLLYTSVPLALQKSDLGPTVRLTRGADAEYSSVIPYAAPALFIFCISEPARPLTTVVNIGRRIITLSVRGVHSSVASGSIISECTHYISHCPTLLHVVFTCREDGACTHTHKYFVCILLIVHTTIVAYVCVWFVVTLREMLTFSTHCWCSKQNIVLLLKLNASCRQPFV